MTDRELLEKAAKAAGIELRWHEDGTAYASARGDGYWGVWNPLQDDGDALRLAVKLKLDVVHFSETVRVTADIREEYADYHEEYGADPYAATRRAIVRAAAEIGSAA